MTHCLNGLGVPLEDIADRLQEIQTYNRGKNEMADGVRDWVERLEA